MHFKLRRSTLEERKNFYKNEFDIKKVASWFIKKPQFFVIDPGSETKIVKDKSKLKKLIVLKPNISLEDLKKKLIYYLPEDVYYDRNQYKDINKFLENGFKENKDWDNLIGQQLVFDVDPENFNCKLHKRSGFTFCENCQRRALENGKELYLFLEREFKFNDLRFVYSGRGCHIHVFDKDTFKMSIKERTGINKELKNFKIDPWVSQGRVRLIKLPYSLNALVSRIVMPLEIKEIEKFNPLEDKRVIPKFLKDKTERFQILKI